MMLPNLMIIGAMKCGTTSLHSYLSLHPQIQMSRPKELDFFVEKYNWHRGIEWYQSHFYGSAKIHGESSPNYTNYPRSPEVAKQMYKFIPDAKLIYLVRDPIKRTVSHYVHKYSAGLEERPIEEALTDAKSSFYLDRSRYFLQLEQFLNYYPKSQILVLSAEDLRQQTELTLQRVFEFLEVDASFKSQHYQREKHRSDRKRRKTAVGNWLAKTPPAHLLNYLPSAWRWPLEDVLYFPFSKPIETPRLSKNLRQFLSDRLQEDVKQFRHLTGYHFQDWQL